MASTQAPPTYIDRLLADLDLIETDFVAILADSQIQNVDPNRRASGYVFVGAAKWGWVPSSPELEARRMKLLGRVRDFEPLLRLLFPHPTPEVTERLDENLALLQRWLERPRDTSIPATIDRATDMVKATVTVLRQLSELLPKDAWAVRVAIDTNLLLDDPDVAIYTPLLGNRYMVHLLPVVLRELDDHKLAGRNADIREAAKKADRRLKGLRTNGNVLRGVRVAGDVHAVFEHIEPKGDGLPNWLDLGVPDDRFVASTLLLQSRHPGSAVYVATRDINLQTKLAAVGLPFIEKP
ncbi:PIN domain-containing protein (plasmid) [Streptomyces sp. NBC_01281]|uniref:PIN domain-containing protein n=1 Tax=Streptomyces sp. NBC_01281 TaxID=2903811 RepID=UPI002E121992|nr:PIN domain-containing protein [Streptomyces sp. NBC_01281]WSK66615.1 PIN domain-containing protein [Streptomyces sp. NBC_01281]